jgi:sec-independent protein translocase protein TatC
MAASELREGDPRLETMTETASHAMPEEEGDDGQGAPMTLVEHLEELRRRALFALVAVAAFTIIGFIFWQRILVFLLTPLPDISSGLLHAQGAQQKLVATSLGEPFMIALKLSLAAGVALASPVVLYQLWAYISPALTRKERRWALPFTLLGTSLFVIGLTVGFVVLRYPVDWLIHFGGNHFLLLLDANAYFSFVAFFLLAFGITFELPLVLTFLGVAGIVSSRVLRAKRMYILFGLWLLSCFITPGADPYSPVIIGVSFTILFELSIVLLRILKK